MRRHRQRKKPIAEINIVPYIDVMLVLLVIFMIATPLLTQGVKVNLPHTNAKVINTQQQLPLIVTVNAEGQYYLNSGDADVLLNAQQLAVRVAAELQLAKQQHATRQVLVRGDRAAAYGKVVEAMALLQKAGVPQVGLITQNPNNKS